MASDEPGSDLPIDADVDSLDRSQRPLHLHGWALALVVAGGTVGTACRAGAGLVIATATIPWATFAVNLVGAFFLGVFLEALVRSGPDTGSRRRARLLVGTGFAGGFTTYSALAVETVEMWTAGEVAAALGYSIGTLILGALGAWLGIVVGARRSPRQQGTSR